MEEQQVQREIAPTDLQRILAAHEAEIAPQLDQKVLESQQQAAMQVGFGMWRG
jgi:hypothetical protein